MCLQCLAGYQLFACSLLPQAAGPLDCWCVRIFPQMRMLLWTALAVVVTCGHLHTHRILSAILVFHADSASRLMWRG
jgi:hypothetical protein